VPFDKSLPAISRHLKVLETPASSPAAALRRTRLEVTGGPYNAATGPNAEQGWSEQLDKLARLLA
jgi:hypothetical protein